MRVIVGDVNHVLFSRAVDFFNCIVCGFLWHVPKGKDGPAGQELLTSPVNEVSKRTRPRGARK